MGNKVILVVNDSEQLTLLEYLLTTASIDYALEVSDGKYGFTPPFLIIHGVPLDEKRSLAWVKEQIL